MPSYRPFPLGKLHQFTGQQAQVLAGGYLKFYQAGTTTPQNVYGDNDLTVNNGSTITLDSAGHPTVDMWADTDTRFYVEVYAYGDVKQWDIDDVEVPGGPRQVIPIPDTDEVIGGDGTNLLVISLAGKLLPDPTGNNNKILGCDGSQWLAIAKPADGAAGVSDIVIGSGSIKWSNGSSHMLLQQNTDTVAGGGGLSTSDTVSFGTAYSATPVVDIIVTGATAATNAGNVEVDWRLSAVSATGFTVVFSSRTGGSSADLSGNSTLTGTINYAWRAIGPTAS